MAHCGTCDNDCRDLPNVGDGATCMGGECQVAAACETGFADCIGMAAGCETNTTNDSDNCGACGHSCLGSTCANSLCVPQVVDLGEDAAGALHIRLNATHVFWTDGNAIYRKAKDLSPGRTTISARTLPSGNNFTAIGSFDLDGTHVYFSANGQQPATGGTPPQLVRRPLDGSGSDEVVITMPGGVPMQGGSQVKSVWASQPDDVYFTAMQYHEGGPYRVSKTSPSLGGALSNASNFPPHEGGYNGNLLLDGVRMFVTGFEMYYAPQFGILQCYVPDCATPVQIATPSVAGATSGLVGDPWMAVDSTRIFWAQHPSGTRVVASPKDTPSTTYLATFTAGKAGGVAADDVDDFVYVLVTGAGGGVFRVRKTIPNQQPAWLVQGQANPSGLAMDATHVYWGEFQTKKIWRVAR